MLKVAPLSTVSGTALPRMDTVATALDPFMTTGISKVETEQLALATAGNQTTSAHAQVKRLVILLMQWSLSP
jgi:hypothetical protein